MSDRLDEIDRLKGVIKRMLLHADDLIADWQAGNIETKDMAYRLQLFVEAVRLQEDSDG